MRRFKARRVYLAAPVLLALSAFAGAFAQQPALPSGIERITSVEGISEYRLANGLRVLLFPDQSKQTITVNITYLVGSAHENYGETGMAHLLEHMVFKGTPRHPDIPQELSKHGARPNGTTSWDRTNYFETFAATEENLKWALDLEADRMVNSFIAKKDLDSEMTVVRNEMEAGENSPFGVTFQRAISTAYLWHNYGKMTIGARSDVENVPIERLQAFYRTYYQPDNAVLLVAGKFDVDKTLGLIASTFGPIPRPSRTIPRIYTIEPTQDGERSVTVRRVGDVQLVTAAYHIPAGSHPDAAAVDVLATVLGATPSGRLHKALVETKKASRVFAIALQNREPCLSLLAAEVRKDDSLDACRDAFLETIEGIARTPITKEEVDRAQTDLLKDIELALNSSDRIGLALSEWVAMGDWRLFFLQRDLLKRVKAEDVNRVASAYLKKSNRTLAMFVPTASPDRAEIPPAPDIAAMLKDYKGEAAVAAGEAFDPSPANIESRTTRSQASVGLKLALLPKKTRGGSVVASLTLRFGDEKSLMNRSTAAQLAAQMLMRGSTKRSRQQIKDEFDRLKARVFVFGGATQAGLSIETVRESLPEVIRLATEVLREPSFPSSEFDQLKQEQLSSLESARSEPQAIASLALRRHLNPYPKGDARYVPTLDEEIEMVKSATLDDARKFYSDFYGSSTAEFAAIGDFDKDEIMRLIGDLLAAWKSPSPFKRVPSRYEEVAPLNRSFETPDKANASFVAGMNLSIRDDHPDYPALVFGNFMLGGNLNSRLATRLRHKEGLSYGVGSSFFASAVDEFGSFTAFAICAPQNVARLEAAFKEEIEKVIKDGFTAEEVSVAKNGYFQSRQVSRAQDAALARTLATYLYLGRRLNWDAELENKIRELTPQQITEAMRRHIHPTKISIVKAGDFAKAGSTKPAAN